jgi:hypothetical protein
MVGTGGTIDWYAGVRRACYLRRSSDDLAYTSRLAAAVFLLWFDVQLRSRYTTGTTT